METTTERKSPQEEIIDLIAATLPGGETKEEVKQPPEKKEETVIVEETKAVVEEKAGEEENDESFFNLMPESLKEKVVEKGESEKKTTEPVVSDSVKKELDELKDKLNDPFVQAVLKYKDLEGFDFKNVLKELYGDDGLGSKSYKDLIEIKIKKEFPNLTADEIKEEVELAEANYSSLSRLQKKDHEDALRASLKSEPTQYLKTLDEALKSKVPVDNSALQKVYEEDLSAVNAAAISLKDQEVWGVKMDEEKIKKVGDSFSRFAQNPYSDYLVKDDKGNEVLDAEKYTLDRLFLDNKKAFLAAAITFGENRAKKKNANIDKNDKGSTTVTTGDTRPMDDQINDEILKRAQQK